MAPDDSNPLLDKLRLAGIVRLENGAGGGRSGLLRGRAMPAGERLVPRNRIYAAVFDPEWVRARLPNAEVARQQAAYRRGVLRTVGVAGLLLAVMAGLTGWAVTNGVRAEASAGVARREATAKAQALRQAEENAAAAQRSAAAEGQARQEAQGAQRKAEQSAGAEAKARREAQDAQRRAEQSAGAEGRARQEAQGAQRRAEESATAEGKARARADQSTAFARRTAAAEREARERREELLYVANLNVIQGDWDRAQPNIGQMLELLEETRTGPHRGFEWGYWNRLCHLDLLTLKGHRGWVNAVAFAPDGQRVLTGGVDKTAKLWDAATGREVRTLKEHTDGVLAVAFAPDGQRVLTGSDDRAARIWQGGELSATAPGARNADTRLVPALSPVSVGPRAESRKTSRSR